jgi:ElaB/YqjD/DUF883 family membrane-anchored ribosome-binding protein
MGFSGRRCNDSSPTRFQGSTRVTRTGKKERKQQPGVHGHEPSLSQIETEAARNRANLKDTVDELQQRVSPSAFKRDMQEYVRETKQGVLRNIEQKARENPLQAVALAAGFALPLIRLVAALPAPLLMIAAGFALSRRGEDGRPIGAKLSESAADYAADATGTLQDKAGVVSVALRSGAQTVREKAHDARDRVTELAATAASVTQTLLATSVTGLRKTWMRERTWVLACAKPQGNTISSVYDSGSQSAAAVRDKVAETAKDAGSSVVSGMQENLLLTVGIGLALGGIIAAALPKTTLEDKVLGGVADDLKLKAKDLASDGLDAAKATAQTVYDQTMEYARQQGVSPENLKGAATALSEKAKELAKVISTSPDPNSHT